MQRREHQKEISIFISNFFGAKNQQQLRLLKFSRKRFQVLCDLRQNDQTRMRKIVFFIKLSRYHSVIASYVVVYKITDGGVLSFVLKHKNNWRLLSTLWCLKQKKKVNAKLNYLPIFIPFSIVCPSLTSFPRLAERLSITSIIHLKCFLHTFSFGSETCARQILNHLRL